jgi:hypothetical protein
MSQTIYKFSKVFSLQKFYKVGKNKVGRKFYEELFLEILQLWFCFLQYCAFHRFAYNLHKEEKDIQVG